MPPPVTATYRRLADELVARIRAGEFPPGSRLPSARQLQAAGWGLSSVQRAMQALAEEGWTRPVSGSGTYVADPVPPAPVPGLSLEERVADLEAWRRKVEGGG